jgi:hypothetical protein
MAKLKKGKRISFFKDKLIIMKWRDKKDICLMSTTSDDNMMSARVRGKDHEAQRRN